MGINLGKELQKAAKGAAEVAKKASEVAVDGTKKATKAATETASNISKNVKMPEIKIPDFSKKGKSTESDIVYGLVTPRNAVKIIYYLMMADGDISDEEVERFSSVSRELYEQFEEDQGNIIRECKSHLDKIINDDMRMEVLMSGTETALVGTKKDIENGIPHRLLIWDLMTIAYCDNDYDVSERDLIEFIAGKLDVDKAILKEMEYSLLTVSDLEKEMEWIKLTDKPYMTIQPVVEELQKRVNDIYESIKELVFLS